jgi:AcrR family transcriptional regulator
VKAPSLYRHVANKDALIQGVGVQMITRLFEAIDEAIASAEDDPAARLMAAAGAYRTFAHANPRTFVLAMTDDERARQPDPDYLVQLIVPLQGIVAEIAGEEDSLPALRGVYALMHGFALAELTGQFRRGGDLDAAYENAVAAQIRGWRRG